MQPAQDPRREAARRELDEILREADELRQALARDRVVGDRSTSPRAPNLALVPGGAPERDDLSGRVRIIYEGEALRLVRPDVVPKNALLFRVLRVTAAALALSLAVVVWVLFPSGPPILEARRPSPEYVEASARYAMWRTAQRLERYARDHRALPLALSELGEPIPELIGYQRVSAETYRLMGPGPNAPIVLDEPVALRSPSIATRAALRGEPRP